MSRKIKVIRCYSEENEVIVLDFMPCKKADYNFIYDFYEESQTEFLRIYQTDYARLLVPYLSKAYPIVHPITSEVQTSVDVCFDNVFSKEDWLKVLELLKLEAASNTVKQEKDFYEAFLLWNIKQLDWAEVMMVEGNQ
ncbi:hypothetical protein [uncultured Enterococcus sp.]|uniref:hypothetical protein n=1 Tax=uncultured Enterococcus sp. TaxID=167972 RepID=UPI002AA93EAB|nr:hypothetical protein [uncultured Enterococcus sp.]